MQALLPPSQDAQRLSPVDQRPGIQAYVEMGVAMAVAVVSAITLAAFDRPSIEREALMPAIMAQSSIGDARKGMLAVMATETEDIARRPQAWKPRSEVLASQRQQSRHAARVAESADPPLVVHSEHDAYGMLLRLPADVSPDGRPLDVQVLPALRPAGGNWL